MQNEIKKEKYKAGLEKIRESRATLLEMWEEVAEQL